MLTEGTEVFLLERGGSTEPDVLSEPFLGTTFFLIAFLLRIIGHSCFLCPSFLHTKHPPKPPRKVVGQHTGVVSMSNCNDSGRSTLGLSEIRIQTSVLGMRVFD